ncbi:MAG: NBR1-Ig-like domain-containing protein [Chloroflexi bacterium]|nr:NBR1-Ig-like domain-containing protein [Chloroflexota bacterium]
MRIFVLISLCAILALTSCSISISAPATPNATPFFVTATLPPTSTPYAGAIAAPSATPVSSTSTTPSAASSGTPFSMTASPNCKDSAVLLQDVTIADGTNVPRGSKFTKTWQFKNNGQCPWNGYTIVFVSGDQMNSPLSVPVPPTAPGSTVNISVDLVAPTADGTYTGYFELHNANGIVLPIGIEKNFWVQITVGSAPTSAAPTAQDNGTPVSVPKGPASCKYTVSASYPDEIMSLINNARTQAGLKALTLNSRLAAAAQGHSIDMACYGLLSHSGSNGSTIGQRISAAGYPATFYEEIIYGGGYPQDAFNWWMNDPMHHAVIFDTRVTEIGVGYAYVADTAAGSYYTVDVGSQ